MSSEKLRKAIEEVSKIREGIEALKKQRAEEYTRRLEADEDFAVAELGKALRPDDDKGME